MVGLMDPSAAVHAGWGAELMADYTTFVDPFVGTTGGGNMFPGVVAAPFAVVKLGPDVLDGNNDAYSGYRPEGDIFGFSMLHESGTGGAPKYGVVSQMPVVGEVKNPLEPQGSSRSEPDVAEVGYYASSLSNGIKIELAGTNHAGMYRYSFPEDESRSVVVDVSHVLSSFRGLGWGQSYKLGNISIAEDGHYEGSGTYDGGWNLSPNWDIHFCGKFDESATKASIFRGYDEELIRYDSGAPLSASGTERVGAVFEFEDAVVTSRIGVSWVSAAKACDYLNAELPDSKPFEAVVTDAKENWNREVFSKIQVPTTNETRTRLLYTALYGMHLIPSNRTGDNPHWSSTEPYYDDIFTFWDLFRCSTALMHILQPQSYAKQIRSLIDIWRHDGYLPDGRSSNFNGRTQGGSNADNILADAYVKGVRDEINWDDAFAAMQTNAEQSPPSNNDPIAPDASTQHGRGALPDWLQYGYITPNFTRAVSRAVEYAGNDFGLYQVARGLGKSAEAATYLSRSRNWRNHWDASASAFNQTGFMVPRNADGTFVPQDPLSCGGCYWGDAYYQGLPWEYSMNAHHDFATTVEYVGGDSQMVARLEKMFERGVVGGNGAFGNTIFNPGNEPSFNTPYLYNYVGRQDLSVQQSRNVADSYYNLKADGIPGNSDAGAMQTWLLWSMIGLYPITGQTTFLIGSPWFESMSISLGDNKILSITSTGGDEEGAIFVQSLRVNGEQWDKNWVAWDDIFANGGRLEFVLGKEMSRWDTGARPPSPAREEEVQEVVVEGGGRGVPGGSFAEREGGEEVRSGAERGRIPFGMLLCFGLGVLAFPVS